MAEKGSGASKPKRLSKSELIQALSIQEDDYEFPGLGTIRIRGLPVDEGMAALQVGDDDNPGDRVKKICLLGIVEPKLELEDMEALAEVSMGHVYGVTAAIMRLSGMAAGQDILAQAEGFLTETPPSRALRRTVRKSSTESPPK